MARPAKHSKLTLIEKLADIFRLYGYDGASMSELSRAAGLSKASLYHHFPGGKKDMAEAVLDAEAKRLKHEVLSPFNGTEEAADALLASLQGVGKFYAGNQPACLINSMLHGSGIAEFGVGVARALDAWQHRYQVAYTDIAGNAQEGKAWAAYALQRIQGALVLCRVRKNRLPLNHCLEELQGDVMVTRDDNKTGDDNNRTALL